MGHNVLSIDDVIYSLQAWSKAHPPGGFQWTVQSTFSNKMFKNLHPFISMSSGYPIISTWSQISYYRYTMLNICFVKENNVHIFMWLSHVKTTIKTMISNNPDIFLISIWIPLESFPRIIHNQVLYSLRYTLPTTWTLDMSLF